MVAAILIVNIGLFCWILEYALDSEIDKSKSALSRYHFNRNGTEFPNTLLHTAEATTRILPAMELNINSSKRISSGNSCVGGPKLSRIDIKSESGGWQKLSHSVRAYVVSAFLDVVDNTTGKLHVISVTESNFNKVAARCLFWSSNSTSVAPISFTQADIVRIPEHHGKR